MSEEIKTLSKEELFILDLKRSTEPTLTEKGKDLLLNYIEDLQQKVEQLENMRKEAIAYIRDNFQQNIITGSEYLIGYSPCTDLLNILNKGSESDGTIN